MEKINYASTKQKKAEAAILISDKWVFKGSYEKQDHYIMTTGSVLQENINNS